MLCGFSLPIDSITAILTARFNFALILIACYFYVLEYYKMKTIFAVITASISAGSALAGAVTYVAPEVVAIEEPTRMGGSGAWLIPLVIIAVLALALTQDSDRIRG